MSMVNLPVHLMVLILQKMDTDSDYSSAAHMRLVSKDWRAAFAECPGSVFWTILHETDLQKICALTPSMSQIYIDTGGLPVFATALADCHQLKKVTVYGESSVLSRGSIAVDLRGLPGNVKQLALQSDVYLLPASFANLTRLSIQTLELDFVRNTFLELNGLLDCLPTLRELCIRGEDHGPHPIKHIIVDSLAALTEIHLRFCVFAPPRQCLPHLQRMHLTSIKFRRAWLGAAFAPLSGLTFLALEHCVYFDTDIYDDLRSISSLRTLQILMSDEHCISFAPATLRSLTVDRDITAPLNALRPHPITRLTGLTRLKLTQCSQMTSPELLRDLPLRELLLLDCHLSIYEQLPSLFIPGALPFLQKLHIEDKQSAETGFTSAFLYQLYFDSDLDEILWEETEEANSQARRLKAAPYFQSMVTLADGIVSLPSLQQVSGCSALFDFGMEDELKDWNMSDGIDYGLFAADPITSLHGLKIWSQA